MNKAPRSEFLIGGQSIAAGERCDVDLRVAPTYTHDDLSMTVQVVHGKKEGPTLFISAAVHGDEINGVEIIRRLLQSKSLKSISGTLLAIPIVNVHGFLNQSRYLPDGRDLNRCFPGSAKGSLAGRVANTFVQEIMQKCSHGIDLHTGSRHRSNFPQIRADFEQEGTLAMTEAFGVPVAMNSALRDGSLRACAGDLGIPVILYEAGEALRFDEVYIRPAVKGILSVMRQIGMLPARAHKTAPPPLVSDESYWIRAPESGVLRTLVKLGAKVDKGQVIAMVADPLGGMETGVAASQAGVVIGRTNLPLVYSGNALFHIARYGSNNKTVERQVEKFQEEHEPDEIPDPGDDPSNAPIL
jgi:predicted deacylase